jgi:hypothetical protein
MPTDLYLVPLLDRPEFHGAKNERTASAATAGGHLLAALGDLRNSAGALLSGSINLDPSHMILIKRFEPKEAVTNYIEEQYGFRKGRGSRDAISMLRCLGEMSLEHGKDFVDYEKAFDRVD